MTQVAEPRQPRRDGSDRAGFVSHWINGARVAGTSGRSGPVFDPATGEIARRVDFASVDEVDRAVAAASAAFPAWRAMSLSKRSEILFRIRNLVEAHRKDLAALLTAEHGKVPGRRPGRSGSRHGEHRVRMWRAAAAQGRLQRAGLEPASTCTRFGSRWASWPGSPRSTSRRWSRCGCSAMPSRLRQHVRPQAVREGPVGLAAHRRAAGRGRRARRRVQRRPGRQGGGRPAPRAPRHRGPELRRLDPDRPLHLRDGDSQRQARAGPGRGQEPHDRAARRGCRHGRRRRRLGRIRLGRRALHGHLGGGRGRRRGRPARLGDLGPAAQDQGRPRLRLVVRDGPADHPRASRPGGRLPRQRRGAGRHGRRRRAQGCLRSRAPASSSGRR